MSVALQDLTVSYGGLVAVDHLTASFPEGSTGLLGPNCAGKSRLIMGLLGLVPLSAGSATVIQPRKPPRRSSSAAILNCRS